MRAMYHASNTFRLSELEVCEYAQRETQRKHNCKHRVLCRNQVKSASATADCTHMIDNMHNARRGPEAAADLYCTYLDLVDGEDTDAVTSLPAPNRVKAIRAIRQT